MEKTPSTLNWVVLGATVALALGAFVLVLGLIGLSDERNANSISDILARQYANESLLRDEISDRDDRIRGLEERLRVVEERIRELETRLGSRH